ncbi:MAG: hypothetical protein IPK27_13070 [Rhodanobacteraceae bacterium]|nr:hypothetical protein [Rhodanobacteraceae bacterium]
MQVDARIEASSLVGTGAPAGMPFDREDVPALTRDVDALCEGLKCSKPAQILHTAEFAIRMHAPGGWFAARKATLALGWPLMQVLDADEVRAALALALTGARVVPGALDGGDDARVVGRVGRVVLARTLSRLETAAQIGREDWLAPWTRRARREAAPPTRAFGELRARIEQRGRGGWQPLLDRIPVDHPTGRRIDALGGPTLAGGSHRSAAAALYWEGLAERVWTALEAPFDALLAPAWADCHAAHADARERSKALSALRRDGHIDLAQLIELGDLLEHLAGARAAHPIWREAYARERRPEIALALARTLIEVDPPRARAALERLAAATHPLAAQAQALLDTRPLGDE